MTRYWKACLLLGVLAWVTPLPAQADCLVRSPATYAVGENIFKDTCDTSGNKPVSLGTLLSGEDQTNNLLMTSGGAVRQTTVASAVTTNTTGAAIQAPTGNKTFAGALSGTGAITQTMKLYGSVDNSFDANVDVLLCTLTLSGTTTVGDACPVITANFSYYFPVSSNTTGTSTSGTYTFMY